MEKHKCKLCPRAFSNGRALGGHMKAHLAALPVPQKTTTVTITQQNGGGGGGGDSTESASSSFSDEKNREIEKSLSYALRNNPKKSFRFVDPEFSFPAADTGSVVQDRESETESKNPTRRRSKRSRKMFSLSTEETEKKPKPSCCLESPTEVSSVSDTSPEEDIAMCLMMLSRDVWMTRNREQEVETEEDVNKSIKKKINRCEKCSKVFRSSQALTSHNKVCESKKLNNNSDEKIFECPFCLKVFGSGQALGGHKRSHLMTVASSSTTTTAPPPPQTNPINNLIDLNLPAPLEDDDYSVVSDA